MRFASAFGLTSFALGLFVVPSTLAQPPVQKSPDAAHKAAFEECAKACHECQRICDACSHHCVHLVANGNKEHLKTMQACQDCAAFCEMTGRIVSTMGPFADIAVDSCATACHRCAAACDRFPDDAHMKKCADECRRCERVCRNMMAAHGLGKPATSTK